MKKLILLASFSATILVACDSKKEGIIDEQKMINKQLTGLQDSMQHAGDSTSLARMKGEAQVLQLKFDSLNNELQKYKK